MATKTIVMRPYMAAAAVTRSRVFPLFQSVKPATISVAVSQSAKRVSCNGESSYLRTGTRIGTRNRNGNNSHERLHGGGGGGGGGRRFSTGVGNSGSMDSPLIQSMEIKIKEHLNADLVSVKDAYGDGRHVSIDVISSAFEGQSAVNRQRMVYKAIWEELQNTVHAVDQMTTKTPAEAAANQ